MKFRILFLLNALFFLAPFYLHGAEPTQPALPGAGFDPARYSQLWTKSPFAVATPEGAAESPDYALVGVAEFDGISYASLTDRHSQEHFVLSSDKPVRGLVLVSINRGKDVASTSVNLQKDGQPLTLNLEIAPSAAAPGMPVANLPPGNVPASASPSAIYSPRTNAPPPVRIHHPLIHLPPQ